MINIKRIILFIIVALFTQICAQAQIINTVVSITGNVLNSVTREPVTVFMKVMNEKGKRINATRSNSAENGLYFITGLKPGKTYYISITQPGWFKEKFMVKVPNTHKYAEISKDFLVKPLKKNVELPLPVSPFELNKSRIRFGADQLLNDFKNTLINNPNVTFDIVCFADNNLDQVESQKLTQDRCKSLMNYLSSAGGVDMGRINMIANKKTDPKNPPPTKKRAKGKRYIGSTYVVVKSF